MCKLKTMARNDNARKGQIVLEYFLIFALVALLTIVGLTTYHQQVADAWKNFFTAAAQKMVAP